MKSFNNESADIGIGTMIIFIAIILVAAVAAVVLIYSAGELQQKATHTANEAPSKVTTNIFIESVFGDRINSTMPGPPAGYSKGVNPYQTGGRHYFNGFEANNYY